ncbi:hypothetical protein D3C83_163240 [compost metagenome]
MFLQILGADFAVLDQRLDVLRRIEQPLHEREIVGSAHARRASRKRVSINRFLRTLLLGLTFLR